MARLAAVLVLAALFAVPAAARAQSPGGHLDVLSASDVDSLDPGYWYYQYDYMALLQPTQRAQYGWKGDASKPTPDMATAEPQLSDGGKTMTIKIRSGVKYSPGPV